MSERPPTQQTHADDFPAIISYASAKTKALRIDGRWVVVIFAGAAVGAVVGWWTFEPVLQIYSNQYMVGEASEPFRIQSSFAFAVSVSGALIGMAAALACRRLLLREAVLWLNLFAIAYFVGAAVGVLLKREQWKAAQTLPPMPPLPQPYQKVPLTPLPPSLVDAPIFVGPAAGCAAVLLVLVALVVVRRLNANSQNPSSAHSHRSKP